MILDYSGRDDHEVFFLAKEGKASALGGMDDVLMVLTTFGEEGVAKRVGRELLELKVVACVSVLPGATSLYHWRGELCEEKEVMVMFKTTAQNYSQLEAALQEMHPYEEPEILAFTARGGSEGYLKFVREGVG